MLRRDRNYVNLLMKSYLVRLWALTQYCNIRWISIQMCLLDPIENGVKTEHAPTIWLLKLHPSIVLLLWKSFPTMWLFWQPTQVHRNFGPVRQLDEGSISLIAPLAVKLAIHQPKPAPQHFRAAWQRRGDVGGDGVVRGDSLTGPVRERERERKSEGKRESSSTISTRQWLKKRTVW